MSDDDGTHMAAGVAYYALFSLFPLLLGLIAVLSLFLESQDIQSRLTTFTTDYLPGSEDLVDTNIDAVLRLRGALGVVAVLGLLWSGSAIFGAVTRAVNRAWDVHKDRPFYISKPRQLVMGLGVAVLFVLSLGAATFVRLTERFASADVPGVGFLVNIGGQVLLQSTAFLLTLAIFLLVYKFMPNTKTYWRYIWPGALAAAVLFELAKNLFILYLNQVATFESVYGTLAPVIVLLLWTYVSSVVLILGAELSSEYGRLRMGVDRGVLIHPAKPESSKDSEGDA
jgi:membrane protein